MVILVITVHGKPVSDLEGQEQFFGGFGGGGREEIRETDIIIQRPGLFGLGGGFEEIRETDVIVQRPGGGFEEIRERDVIIQQPGGLLGGLEGLLFGR